MHETIDLEGLDCRSCGIKTLDEGDGQDVAAPQFAGSRGGGSPLEKEKQGKWSMRGRNVTRPFTNSLDSRDQRLISEICEQEGSWVRVLLVSEAFED